MSEYKRVVSYLYKYEQGNKGENAGYVRIDVRKGDLKLLIHTQDKKALKGKEFQVYLYYRDGEKLKGVYGGSLTFHQGESEFRRETKEASLFDSGHSLDKMGGLILYYNKDLAYGTEWDDRPIVLSQFEEKEEEARQQENGIQKAKEAGKETVRFDKRIEREKEEIKNQEEKKDQEEVEVMPKNIQEEGLGSRKTNENVQSDIGEQLQNVLEDKEKQDEKEELKEIPLGSIINTPDSIEKNKKNDWMSFYHSEPLSHPEMKQEAEHETEYETVEDDLIVSKSNETKSQGLEEKEREREIEEVVEEKQIEEMELKEDTSQLQTAFFDLTGLSIDEETLLGLQAIYQGSSIGKELVNKKQQKEKKQEVRRQEERKKSEIKSDAELYELILHSERKSSNNDTTQKQTSDEMLQELMETSPKITHSMNHQIRNAVRVHPQDLGKLAISNWHFGTNSFVIHGYYQFNYLIIGIMLKENSQEQPIIGVPGFYTNQDRYMARQFGFKEFLPVKPAQTRTGSFGYWVANLIQ